jgi:hypothetical protein
VPSLFRRVAVRTNMSPDHIGESQVQIAEHAEACH